MQIVFFCPPAVVINGGIKHIFHMAERLIDDGHDAIVFEEMGRRPPWVSTRAPVMGQGAFRKDGDQLYVLPEDQKRIFEIFADWPQRKIVYVQNHFYSAMGIGAAHSFADYGVTDLLCSSHVIQDAMARRHPTCATHHVPCYMERGLFKPAPKLRAICYMPRKRSVEAVYIRDMFRFTYPEYKDWDWIEIRNKSEAEVAQFMGEAAVFLSLSRLEGLGLTPLEAMASGCVVAGFTGIGGREYARPDNGFWAAEDDFEGVLTGLKAAVDLAALPPEHESRQAYAAAAARTIENYTKEGFDAAVQAAFAKILGT